MESNKEKIITSIRKKIENISNNLELGATQNKDQQLEILSGELQISQLELEMQNDKIFATAQMAETQRTKFESFFNLAPVGYFILNYLGEVIEANQVGLDLVGAQLNKNIKHRFQNFIFPEHWEKFYSFLRKMKPNAAKESIEIKLASQSGNTTYTRMEGIAVDPKTSEKILYYITLLDITPSRNTEQELRNTTQRLAITLEASGMGTWTIDLKENSIFIDNYGLSLLEMHPWDFDGSIKKFIANIYLEDQLIVKNHFLNNANNLQKIDVEFRVLTTNGKIKYMVAQGCLVEARLPKLFFAGVIIDITDRKYRAKLEQELLDEKQKLILSTTINAQEKEREKISSILHDSICQLLYGIRLNLQNTLLEHKIPNDFKNVHDLLALAIKETRELSYELTPSILRDFGLTEGILEMTKRMNTNNFQITTQINRDIDKLNSDLQLSIFRIIQELLNNCIKHASASKAEIKLSLIKHNIEVVVNDNGVGFGDDLEKALIQGSGLRGIKNRIFLLNGELNIKTSNLGTQVKIKFNKK